MTPSVSRPTIGGRRDLLSLMDEGVEVRLPEAPKSDGILTRVGDWLQGGGAELETLGDPANAPAAEAVLKAVPTLTSGAVSWMPAGLSMFSFDTRGLDERAQTARDIQEALTYEPRDKLTADAVRGITYPIELLKEAGETGGAYLEEKGYPFLGAVARTAGEAAPFIIPGIPKAVKEIRGSTWYRTLTVKERGLIDPIIKDMAADIASGDLTTAQIRELWKDPANRETLLKRYQGIGEEATGNVKTAGEPIRASGAEAVKELPAGQGFQLRPTTEEVRDLLATMREEGPKALPAGQGFELRPTVEEVRDLLAQEYPAALPYPEGVGEGFTSRPGGVESPIVTKKGTPFKTEAGATAAGLNRAIDWNLYEVTPVEGGFAITRKAGMEFRPETGGRAPSPLSNQRGSIDIGPAVEAIRRVSKEAGDIASEMRRTADEYLGAISTRLGNIHPSLKNTLRAFEYQTGTKKNEYAARAMPFLEKMKNVSPTDREAFDLARKNGDPQALKQFVTKYGLGKEYHDLRVLLKDLYDQAKDVGFDVGYRQNFHPRVLKDPKGFLEYFYKQKDWPVLEKAIRQKEVELQRYLEPEEKAQLINNMLRGYPSGNISLTKPGQMKAREIEKITTDLNKFYMDSDAALVSYINAVTDAIEARRLFGKDKTGKTDINDTIGGYVLDLLQKGKIRAEDEAPLREILSARFNEVGTRGLFGLYKNLSYIDTMGSPISAVTQIGDLAWALYKNGIGRTATATAKAVAGKSTFKREDVGISKIAQEFADTSKAARAVDRLFKMTGLEKIDNIGKESLINSTYVKARQMAVKDPAKLKAELEPIFEGETAQLIADLKAGKITENVKLYLFNTLADFQPIALSEMPAKYLTGGNGRIFYMLKTFTLKQFDAFRREAFQKIATEGQRTEGIKNLVKLTGAFVAANATADVIKDLILGRPINVDDKVVDNLCRLLGVSKFVTWQARMEGPRSAVVKQIAPPFKFADALYKDIATAGDEKGLETAASIPLVGKLYYWWFGKGAEKSARQSTAGGRLVEPKEAKLKTLKGGLK